MSFIIHGLSVDDPPHRRVPWHSRKGPFPLILIPPPGYVPPPEPIPESVTLIDNSGVGVPVNLPRKYKILIAQGKMTEAEAWEELLNDE